MHDSGGRLPVVIRALGMRDLPGLVRMRHGGVRLDLPETLLGAYTPLKGIAQSRWSPLRRNRVRTYVAVCEGTPMAFVQTRDRPGGHKWDILHLGAAGAPAAAGRRIDLWTALLEYTTTAAGRRGIQRLYAKLPSGVEASEAFQAAGYVRYGEEAVYLLQGSRQRPGAWAVEPVADEEIAPRPQAPGDAWALHQLYTWTAPKPVQYAEAHTSNRWELPARGLLGSRVGGQGGAREWGFIVERGHEIVLYCRVGRQGDRSRLEFLFDPQRRELLEPTIGVVLRWLAPGPGERVYCTVREFQGELGGALETLGFEPLGVQDLLVRYTTASVRSLARQSWPALEKVRGGVPARLSLNRQEHRERGMTPLGNGVGGSNEIPHPALCVPHSTLNSSILHQG